MEQLPSVVIVGRPNVGKSTLFNRITGQRRAIVGDEPGITRDRNYGTGEWQGRSFQLVDTGGMIAGDAAQIPTQIVAQAKVAIDDAAMVIMVVDGRSELTANDVELARLLLRTGKPLVLAVNKIDTPRLEAQISDYFSLGISKVIPISAEHSAGVDDLLDEITAGFEISTEEEPAREEINVAIIGRPNVGKSTLLNRLAGAERSIVSQVPGTTRDAVDTLVEQGGIAYRLVDTAGIRRKGKTSLMAEKLSVVMARRHMRLCDVALLLLSAPDGVIALDATIAGYASESGKSVIVVVNKWDQVERSRQAAREFLNDINQKFKFLDYAPKLFISAKTGYGVKKILSEVKEVYTSRRTRIPTAELNRFLQSIDLERASTPYGRRPKIYYMTQSNASPPTFVLFTDQARRLHFSFERFLVNQIRSKFGFRGSPIIIKQRMHH
ncbi:MAG: ribosome biogenesis GTPase Der [Acidobacteria bacterium]|nr:ribosome biogenesis GTPase Der [Acidobacteriota bacterium]